MKEKIIGVALVLFTAGMAAWCFGAGYPVLGAINVGVSAIALVRLAKLL